jgi:DNA-binding NtrC family response regulator
MGDRVENIKEALAGVSFFPSSRDEKEDLKVSMDKGDKSLFGTETVLFVENDAFWQEFMEWALNDTGYTFISTNSDNAFSKFDENVDRIDLVIADRASSGKGLIKYAKSKKPEVKTILTMGDYSRLSDTEEDTPASAVIQKPYSSYTFARTVRDVLDGKTISE